MLRFRRTEFCSSELLKHAVRKSGSASAAARERKHEQKIIGLVFRCDCFETIPAIELGSCALQRRVYGVVHTATDQQRTHQKYDRMFHMNVSISGPISM